MSSLPALYDALRELANGYLGVGLLRETIYRSRDFVSCGVLNGLLALDESVFYNLLSY